jgi:phage terminase large subunit
VGVHAPLEPRKVTLQLPRKLAFLLEPHPYKVAWGGRNSLKSWSFARCLLTLGIKSDLRILCARQVQKSLAQSVHQLLKDQIEELGYGDLYDVTDNAIRGKNNNTLFAFTGLADHTVDSIKSFEGFDILWVEEGQAVTKKSWQIVLPTIFRTPNSEVWVSFNPDMDTDETWLRFVTRPPEGAKVVEMNYRDAISAGWWNQEQEKLRQYDLVHAKDEYANIWDGKPKTVVAGAIYAREVVDLIAQGRYGRFPYDPKLPVHRIWDLGWNDKMSVIMVQKPHPSAITVVNYLEDNQITYAALIADMNTLGYVWGDDWLPHDGDQHDPKSGTSAKKMLKGFGCRVKDIKRSDPEARIKAARMMFPRVYVDATAHEVSPDRPDRYLGPARLMECLKRYKRAVPKSTNEPASPVHDEYSHGADAYGGLAEIVDQIRNETDIVVPYVAPYENSDQSMGLLG